MSKGIRGLKELNDVIASAPPVRYADSYQGVGDEIHEAYRVFGRQASEAGWGVARLCLLTISRGCPAMHAYKIAAEDAGLSQRTVRLYCQVCAYFDSGTIEEYCSLGFGITHFVACLQAPDPMAALKWALESADRWGGKPASVDVILARWVLPHDEPPEPEAPPTDNVPAWLVVLRRFTLSLSGESKDKAERGLLLLAEAFGLEKKHE